MNEQLQNTINEILQRSIELFNSGADWMTGEIPDVVEQLLIWNFTQSLIISMSLLGIGLLVVIATNRLRKIAIKAIEEKADWAWHRWDETPSNDATFLKSCPFWIIPVGFLPLFCNIIGGPAWLKIWIAPKLYLLEYATALMK